MAGGLGAMPRKKSFLLRTEPEVLDALKRWAKDELRSVNGQLEFVLRRALRRAGRLPAPHGRRPPRGDAR